MITTTALQKPSKVDLVIYDLKQFIREERLNKDNFWQLDSMLFVINSELKKGTLTNDGISRIRSWFDSEFLRETIHGLGFMKPNGYPGDYLFLDRIYTRHISKNPKYGIWDEYVQQHAAPNAVRNRKAYLKKLVLEKAADNSRLNLLNVVSGSGRELFELYGQFQVKNVNTTCVEIDQGAINFSKRLNNEYLENINYVHSNVFKFRNNKTYDMIWSAGLFDYLNDKAFVFVLKKFKDWLSPRGEIIIGNYNEEYNPSRDYLEILGDWHLIHRTEAQLISLANEAGLDNCIVKVNRLEDNVILYLSLKMK
ncbi:class I SAM-dependent methyltransferase [Maribacter halichondriae]|uniref:class I SAM-dependent methyltransferase n=1 Tax=Maribacter halichondriae TaxID=2980554 RepID=UPI002358C842|nr:class I SAM-dependent methyltransferase [Maribacter sp. Hal144]